MKKLTLIIFITFISIITLNAQDVKIGAQEGRFNYTGGFYDFSDPRYVNIMVNIWGYVRFPGKYYVPEQSKITDLISYAGGPIPDAHLDDVRLYRTQDENSATTTMRFNLENMMFKSKLEVELEKIPQLKAGDIIVIPGEPRLYLRDYISITATVTSTIVSILTFVLVVLKR